MTMPDRDTIVVRDSDAIDAAGLHDWIARAVPEHLPAGARLTLRQFPAGFSNLTYLVTVDDGAVARRYVLRRPPRGVQPGIAHDVAREYALLSALHPRGVPVPRPVASCDDPGVIGAPFYLMDFVDGVILRGATPPELPPDADGARTMLSALSGTFVSSLVRLHGVDVSSGPLSTVGRPEGYVRRQVEGWTRRWHASRTDDIASLDRVARWLDVHRPPERGAVLIHNDFKFDNLVLDRASMQQVVAILDWEMATVGDPLMDLGTSLAYWVEADDPPIFRALGLGVTALPGSVTRAELVQRYGAASGRDVSDAPFYYAFGLFKVAVIAQQIFARYRQGLTSDPRFARLGTVVAELGESAWRTTERGEV